MSFGGSDLSQKLWFEMELVGGEVADEIQQRQDRIQASAASLFETFAAGGVRAEELIVLMDKLGKIYGKLEKSKLEFIAATQAEAQAEIDLAAVRANLAQKAERDEGARIEQVLAGLASEKSARQTEIQAERDLAAVRASLGKKAEQDERQRIEGILQGVAEEKEAQDRLVNDRIIAANKRNEIEGTILRARMAANQSEKQAETDLAAVRKALGEKADADAKDITQRRAEYERTAAENIKASMKGEADAWAAGFTQANKLADAEANHERALKRVASAIQEQMDAERELRKLKEESWTVGMVKDSQLEAARARLTKATKETAEADRELIAANSKVVESATASVASTDKSAMSHKGMSQAVQGSSRAFQDFTSASMNGGFAQGVNAITNNVDQVVYGFAKMKGMTGEAAANIASMGTFVAVGLQLAIPIVAALAKEFNLFADDVSKGRTEVERLEAKIKELKDKPIKLAVDRNELKAAEEDLKRITAAQEAYNSAKTGKSKVQRDSESLVKDLIAEAGGEDVTQALKGQAVRDAMEASKAFFAAKESEIATRRGQLKDAQDHPEDFNDEFERSAIVQQLQNEIEVLAETIRERHGENNDAAEKRVGELLKGDAGKLADALKAAGRSELARDVRDVSPASIKANEKWKANMERQDAANDAMLEKEEEDRRAAKKDDREQAKKDNQDVKGQDAFAKFKAQSAKIVEDAKKRVAAEGNRAVARQDTEDAHTATQFGKGIMPDVEAVIADQRVAEAQQAEMEKTPQGRRRIKQNARMGIRPMSREQLNKLLEIKVAQILKASNAPHAQDDARRNNVARKIVGNAETEWNANQADNLARNGNVLESTVMNQRRITAVQNTERQRLNRLADEAQRIRQQTEDMRFSDMPTGY